MAINKVVYDGNTLIDLTSDTATASDVASGKTFHLADGSIATGTASGGGGDNYVVVTLTLNSQSDTWEPDRTYAELYAAYQAEKTIAWVTADGEQSARGYYNSYANGFEYYVEEYFDDSTGEGYVSHAALLDSNGVTDYGRDDPAYYTYYATAVPSDVANGKVFFNADGMQTGTASGGGGASSWTNVAETSYQVSTTSTTASDVGTFTTGHSEIWTSDKILYIRIRDTAGKRNGYYYGTDAWFINMYPKNSSSTTETNTGLVTQIWSVDSSGNYTYRYGYGATGYGIYPLYIYSDGRIELRKRYNATYSRTVNGTYSVQVYLLDPPTGAPIFT